MITNGITLLGEISFKIQGDCGELSTYTNRRGKVIFLKAWLRDPASPRQIAHRNRVRAAAAAWKQLSTEERSNWEQVTKKLSLGINGFNLFVCWHMCPWKRNRFPTLERQSGINFLPA